MFLSWLGPYWHHSQFHCNNTNSDGICRSEGKTDATPCLIFERIYLITYRTACKVSSTQTFPKELRMERKHLWLAAGGLEITCSLLLILLAVKFCLFQFCLIEHANQFIIKIKTINASDSFFCEIMTPMQNPRTKTTIKVFCCRFSPIPTFAYFWPCNRTAKAPCQFCPLTAQSLKNRTLQIKNKYLKAWKIQHTS